MSNVRSIQKHIVDVNCEEALKAFCRYSLENLQMSLQANSITTFVSDLNLFVNNVQNASYNRLKALFNLGFANVLLSSNDFAFVADYLKKKSDEGEGSSDELEIHVRDESGTVIEVISEGSIKI